MKQRNKEIGGVGESIKINTGATDKNKGKRKSPPDWHGFGLDR